MPVNALFFVGVVPIWLKGGKRSTGRRLEVPSIGTSEEAPLAFSCCPVVNPGASPPVPFLRIALLAHVVTGPVSRRPIVLEAAPQRPPVTRRCGSQTREPS